MKQNLNTLWARLIVEELIRCGVDYFCISPGSRSAPLVAAVARNRRAQSIICYDERSCAFHALGYARASARPAAVITTSGTAVANLYPAVVEAAADCVPLLLLTADRPPELTDTGANQTLNQDRFFASFARWHFDLACPSHDIAPEVVLTTIDHAVYRSRLGHPGPVHINCRYREPLEPDEPSVDDSYTANIRKWTDAQSPFTTHNEPAVSISDNSLADLFPLLQNTDRGMLVIGRLKSTAEQKAALALAARLNWTTYADVTSSLRLTDCPTHIIRYFDQQLLTTEFNHRTRPHLVLHLGGRVTSKRLPQFLDANRPEHYIVIKDTPERYDPAHAVSMHIQSDVSAACNLLLQKLPQQGGSDYMRFFTERMLEVTSLIARNIEQAPALTEPFLAAHISDAIPPDTCLFLSNSMPIRDMDLYATSTATGITVAANRGISGIDGVISTAAGFATAQKKLTTLLIGDLAFIHDLNALASLRSLEYPLIIVLVNNRGGGIFHFLPISQHKDIFEPYFAAPHDFTFAGACQTFDADYYSADTKTAFAESYRRAVAANRSAVIEVTTDRNENLNLRRSMKKKIIDLLNASVPNDRPTANEESN